MAAHLRSLGRSAVVPALTEVLDGEPPYYPRFADVVAACAGAGPVVLAGHSGAGSVLPAVAERLGDRVRAAVFVDAPLPHPGRSWFDTAPPDLRDGMKNLAHDGRLPRWHELFPPGMVEALVPDPALWARFVAELPRVPLPYFEEPAPRAPIAHGVYVRLSEAYDREAAEAARLGWPVHRLDADHLAPLTRPAMVGDLLAAL
ncbi:MAG TPA: alpha/beta hydrolase [Amycolatopsis sp.]|nr:alpha/beta hydrolase [Amycolatopsis sp.]